MSDSVQVTRIFRVTAWLTPLIIAAIGWRYLGLVAEATAGPPFQGNNVWLIVWTSAAVIVILAVALAPKRAAFVGGIALGCSTAAVLILSGLTLTALVVAWLLGLCIVLGDRILNAFGLQHFEYRLERLTFALLAGFVTMAVAAFALAVFGLFRSVFAWSLLIGFSVLEARHALWMVRNVHPRLEVSIPIRESRVLILLTSLVVLANLIWAVAPEVEYDSLNYHLSVPRFYLDAGGLVDLPYFFHSYFAHLTDIFFGLCMALHGPMAAKLANFGLGVASMAGVFCLGQLLFNRRVALWASSFYYTTPLTGWLTGTAYTDLTLSFLLTAALIALLRWRRTKFCGWLALSGFFAGAAIGVKLNALFAVIGLGLAVAGLLWRTAEPIGRKLKAVLMFSALIGSIAIPWYLPAFAYTGNPVFPMLNGIFRSPRASPSNTTMDSKNFGVGTAPNALLELPARLTFSPRFGTKAGTLGVLALFCVPFGLLLLILQRNSDARLVAMVAGVYMILWTVTFQEARYYIIVLPWIAVLGIAGVMLLYRSPIVERVVCVEMLILLVAQATLLCIQYPDLPERFPIHVALGLETRDSFLGRFLAGYNATIPINRNILPGQRVLGIDTEYLRLYLKPPIDVLSETLDDHPLRTVRGSDEEIARGLQRIGYAYLLLTRQSIQFPKPWFEYANPQFLDRFATLEYKDERVALYKLNYEPNGTPHLQSLGTK